MSDRSTLSRRGFVRTLGTAAAVGGTAAGTANAQQPPSFGGWLSETSNYDGVVDRTGQSSVEITVGAEANGGAFGFGPAAVRVDPGTTVTWRWNGEGGAHNVVATEGADVDSGETTAEAGTTYEFTFESSGVTKYQCDPHAPLGMKGVVVVGDVDLGGTPTPSPTPVGGDAGGDDDEDDIALGLNVDEIVGVVGTGALAVFILGMGYMTWLGMKQDEHSPEASEED